MIDKLKTKLSFLKNVIKITYKAMFDKNFDIKKELENKEFIKLKQEIQSELDKYKVNTSRSPYLFNFKQKKEQATVESVDSKDKKTKKPAPKQPNKTKTPNKKKAK